MSAENKIDLSALIEASDGDSALMGELVNLFFDSTNREMDKLNDAVDDEDFKAISRVAHKLVGSSMACGLAQLAIDYRELELCTKTTLPDDLDERVARIERMLAESQIQLKNLVEN